MRICGVPARARPARRVPRLTSAPGGVERGHLGPRCDAVEAVRAVWPESRTFRDDLDVTETGEAGPVGLAADHGEPANLVRQRADAEQAGRRGWSVQVEEAHG